MATDRVSTPELRCDVFKAIKNIDFLIDLFQDISGLKSKEQTIIGLTVKKEALKALFTKLFNTDIDYYILSEINLSLITAHHTSFNPGIIKGDYTS